MASSVIGGEATNKNKAETSIARLTGTTSFLYRVRKKEVKIKMHLIFLF
jgi:hypothetical protein